MTEPSDPPDVAAAVQALKPELTRLSIIALVAMMLVGGAGLTGTIYVLNLVADGEDRFKAAAFIVIFTVVLMFYANSWMRKRQEALVMPKVAEAVGLTYSKDAKAFLNSLPDRLLPRATVRKAEDCVYGRLGNHSLEMAEVKVETGGKNSRTLFRGVVARFQNAVAMPVFFLAPPEQTAPGMIFRAWIPTDGLQHWRDVTGPSGKTYGVWTLSGGQDQPPALMAVVEVLTSLENRLEAPMTLFTATSDGVQTHIALEHERNLFRVGGFFPGEAQLFDDVHAATRDLAVPLGLVRELVAAESVTAGKVAPRA